jgi:hypothetical protein
MEKMVGAVRFEPSPIRTDSPDKLGISEASMQANTHPYTQSPGITCPELARVVVSWNKLPEHVRRTIVTLIDTM